MDAPRATGESKTRSRLTVGDSLVVFLFAWAAALLPVLLIHLWLFRTGVLDPDSRLNNFGTVVGFSALVALGCVWLARLGSYDRVEVDKSRSRIEAIKKTEAEANHPSAKAELLELESTVAFQDQAAQARSGSRLMLIVGVAIVMTAIGIGVVEILSTNPDGLSTGDGIVRASVIGAVFYLAGQMFRRATTLERRADDLDRAVVALRHGKDLSKDIKSADLRDKALTEIYTSHLAARIVENDDDNTLSDVIAAILKRS